MWTIYSTIIQIRAKLFKHHHVVCDYTVVFLAGRCVAVVWEWRCLTVLGRVDTAGHLPVAVGHSTLRTAATSAESEATTLETVHAIDAAVGDGAGTSRFSYLGFESTGDIIGLSCLVLYWNPSFVFQATQGGFYFCNGIFSS